VTEAKAKVAPLLLDMVAAYEVEKETKDFFQEALDYAQLPEDERKAGYRYQSVSPDFLREWLIAALAKPGAPTAGLSALTCSTAINTKLTSMQAAVTRLDEALRVLTKNTSATISTTNLYVDHPEVMAALKGSHLVEGDAAVVGLPGYWASDVNEADTRADCLMGVVRWQGYHLCRPVLADLAGFEAHFTKRPDAAPAPPKPTVNYVQRMGNH
jgi:hypothetical protein